MEQPTTVVISLHKKFLRMRLLLPKKGVTGLMEENGLLCIAISLPLPVRVDLKVLIMIPMVVFFSVMTF